MGGHSCLFLLGSFRLYSTMQSEFVKEKNLAGRTFFRLGHIAGFPTGQVGNF